MKLTAIAAAAAIIVASQGAWAQAAGEASAMPECTGPCTYSHQTIGDTTDTVDSSNSYSKQLNPSSNSNASGVDIGADQRLQQSGNTVDQSGNRLGDSNATARGNTTTIGPVDNTSDASNYASNVGGKATVGDTTSRAAVGDTSAAADQNVAPAVYDQMPDVATLEIVQEIREAQGFEITESK